MINLRKSTKPKLSLYQRNKIRIHDKIITLSKNHSNQDDFFEKMFGFEREVIAFCIDEDCITEYNVEVLSGFKVRVRYTINNDINWQEMVVAL